MTTNFRLSNNAASAAVGDGTNKGLLGFLGSNPKIKFYTGSQNSSPENAPGGTLLGTQTIDVVWGNTVNGSVLASNIPSATAVASGTATSFWLTKNDGTTPVADGTVGTVGCDANMENTAIVQGGYIVLPNVMLCVPPH